MILDKHKELAQKEAPVWEKWYGSGQQVLDVGAGEGETADYFLRHGAEKVICIESDPEKLALLKRNFPGPNVIGILAKLDHGKIDIDGSEKNWRIETHDYPMRLRVLWKENQTRLCILEYNPWNLDYRLHRFRIGFAHFLRQLLTSVSLFEEMYG